MNIRVLATLFEHMQEGVIFVTPDGGIHMANPAAERLLCLSCEEMRKRNVFEKDFDLVKPDGTVMPPQERAGARALRENKLMQTIAGVNRPDGSVLWLKTSAVPIEAESGDVEGAIITFVDIASAFIDADATVLFQKLIPKFETWLKERNDTLEKKIERLEQECLERRATEIELQQSEKWLRAVLNSLPVIIFATDEKGTFITHEGKWIYESGMERGHIVGCSAFELFGSLAVRESDGDVTDAESVFHRVLSGESVAGEIESKGRIFNVFASPIYEAENIAGIVGVEIDVTERKNLEKQLEYHTHLLEIVYASLDEAVFIIEARTRKIISCNAAAENIFGYDRAGMIGRNTAFIHVTRRSYGDYVKKLIAAIDADDVFRMELNMRRKDGTVFPTAQTVKVIRDEYGEVSLVVSVIRDITEKKKADEAIRENEKKLREESIRLEEMITALKVLAEHRDREKNDMEAGFSESLNTLIMPFLDRMRRTKLDKLQEEHINALEAAFAEMSRPHGRKVAEKLLCLSPTEVQVANYIKQGYYSKKIASEMNVSLRTVEFHRNTIRKKLGLTDRNINLKTYLSSMT
jgi:PAS domain S-box-containing protein